MYVFLRTYQPMFYTTHMRFNNAAFSRRLPAQLATNNNDVVVDRHHAINNRKQWVTNTVAVLRCCTNRQAPNDRNVSNDTLAHSLPITHTTHTRKNHRATPHQVLCPSVCEYFTQTHTHTFHVWKWGDGQRRLTPVTYLRLCEKQIGLLRALDEVLHVVDVRMTVETEMRTPQVDARIVDDLTIR